MAPAPAIIRNVRAVAVVRPPLAHDADPRECLAVRRRAEGEHDSEGGSPACYALEVGQGAAGKPSSSYTFPAVYGHQALAAEDLCRVEIEPLLAAVFAGESSAVIAYGQTGAGKSFACGTEASGAWGGSVGAYAARRLFELAGERGCSGLRVEAGFIEVYKEGSSKELVYNLLQGLARVKLGDYSEAAYPWRPVASPADVLEALARGARARATERTAGNARSSRSHAILTLRVRHTGSAPDGRPALVSGRFQLVDLAGAEAASAAEAGSALQKQGAGINVGLGTLQQVIHDVARTGSSVRYRDSKLTFILKPALGGAGGEGYNAVFLGCVSPLAAHRERTVKTLDYMQQAGSIRNRVSANVEARAARREEDLARRNEALTERLSRVEEQLGSTRAALAAATAGAAGADAAPPPPRCGDVVVLSSEEHRALVAAAAEQRDRADALEVLLQEADRRHEELQAQQQGAAPAAPAPAPAASDAAAATPAPAAPPAPLPPLSLAPLPVSKRPTPVGTSPALAALGASPVLAAARSMLVFGEDAADSDAADAPPALTADEVCLAGLLAEDCNLEGDQLSVLRRLVERRLADAAEAEAAAIMRGGAGRAAARRMAAEIAALQLAVRSYNECLGELAEQVACANATVQQAAAEKVRYVQLSAKYEESLSVAQHDVRVMAAREAAARGARSPSPVGVLLSRVVGRAAPPGSPAPAGGLSPPWASPQPSPPAFDGGLSASPPPSRIAALGAMLQQMVTPAPPPAASRPAPPSEVVDLTRDGGDAAAQAPAAGVDSYRPRRQLLPNAVVPTTAREERALRQEMQAGVDAGAIPEARRHQVSTAFLESNAHWQPGQAPRRARSRR
jgi:hypothetical protein